MTNITITQLRDEISVKAKNGFDFTMAGGIIWLLISFIWTMNNTSYNKSIFTFIIGAVLLPLAFLFSKLFRTEWKVPNNQLQPLGLQLNFAQLFYFPFLVFILIKSPDYFIMTYAIITGAHFFPYSWFFKTPFYAVFAGIISVGSLLLALIIPTEKTYLIPLFTSGSLFILTLLLYIDYNRKLKMKVNTH